MLTQLVHKQWLCISRFKLFGFSAIIKVTFTGNGIKSQLTLYRNVNLIFEIEIFVPSVMQELNETYTVFGVTLTFTGTPSNVEVIYVVCRAVALQTVYLNHSENEGLCDWSYF